MVVWGGILNNEHLKLLEKAALDAEHTFSNRTEEIGKRTGITFSIEVIKPMSEETATVTFLKSDGTRALAFFYLIQYKNGKVFRYFFPTDSHIAGFNAFGNRKAILEEVNYEFKKIMGDV